MDVDQKTEFTRTPPLSSPPKTKHTPTKNGEPSCVKPDNMKAEISKLVTKLAPLMRESYDLIQRQHFWRPQGEVDDATRDFYKELEIPLRNGKPKLLLHGLGASASTFAETLFGGHEFKILCNVSGSGKTRLLFEGLCQHWGFYFVANRSSDGIGAPDLATAISNMKRTPGWRYNIFENNKEIKGAKDMNETIAAHTLDKLFLARWIIFYAFLEAAIERAKKPDGKREPPLNIRRDWLLFQIDPARIDTDPNTNASPWGSINPFEYVMLHLMGADPATLADLILHYSCCVRRIIEFAPIYFVIDEAQAAGEECMGAFSGREGQERPVLRPLVQYLSSKLGRDRAILAGTGFSLPLFQEVSTSSVAKIPWVTWKVEHFTGDFSNQHIQLSYVLRYLPPTFLASRSGDHLKTRVWKWLRGRHRFTACYLEEVLSALWKGNQPACPHKFLNHFVYEMAQCTLRDGDETILAQEPNPTRIWIPSFDWRKLQEDTRLLKDVASSVHSFFILAKPLEWSGEYSALVEYGFGRFVDWRDKIKIEEPLVLLALTRFFETKNHTLLGDVNIHMQLNQGRAFEAIVLVTMTGLLEKPVKLSGIVNFDGVKKPAWADDLAQIVIPQDSGGYQPFSIDMPNDLDSAIPCSANGPVAVTGWLKTGQEGWCIPDTMMGPDLMARLRIGDKLVLMVIQAKCYSTGNKDETLSAGVTAEAIRSLIPDNFFRSSLKAYKSETDEKVVLRQQIKTMHAAIAKFDGILQVVAAYPHVANFTSRSEDVQEALSKNKHPLATLSRTAFVNQLSGQQDGRACVERMMTLIRRGVNDDKEDEADEEDQVMT